MPYFSTRRKPGAYRGQRQLERDSRSIAPETGRERARPPAGRCCHAFAAANRRDRSSGWISERCCKCAEGAAALYKRSSPIYPQLSSSIQAARDRLEQCPPAAVMQRTRSDMRNPLPAHAASSSPHAPHSPGVVLRVPATMPLKPAARAASRKRRDLNAPVIRADEHASRISQRDRQRYT